ncbi:MAG: DNA repair protein RecN [Chloroflexi bacterium]|nr:MAG: DNA repair protein RecN [Chloroflexota bacterium]
MRSGAEKAVIEGVFSFNAAAKGVLWPLLHREELLDDESAAHITLTREIRKNGRSSARVNGVTVNIDILSKIGEALVDIHGQSDHLSLLRPRTHIDLLDRYADLLQVRSAFAKHVSHLEQIRAEIRGLQEDEDALNRRAERLRRDIEEIEAARLQVNEEDELRAERKRLTNSEQLATLTSEALMLLTGEGAIDDQTPAVDMLMRIATIMHKLATIDTELEEDSDMANSIAEQAQELGLTLAHYAEEIEFSPERLNEIEERLELIGMLKRRYGAVNIEGILDYAEQAQEELDSIEHSEERLEELRAQEEKLLHTIGGLADKLSDVRQKIGQKLGERVVQELADLRMERTRFEVRLTQKEDPEGCYVGDKRLAFDGTGIDTVEFLMSANPGEPLRPLAKVASGGETARIMLALKRVLSQADQTQTLIFDEIDQGIGGRVGAIVGEKLWSLTDGHQVLVVTHLPQLASFADKHFRVQKAMDDAQTQTEVIELTTDEQRVAELADMLGAIGEAGRQSAVDILAMARERKGALRRV